MAGTGTESGKNVVINLPSGADVDVKALGFMTGNGNPARVRIAHNTNRQSKIFMLGLG